MRNDIISRRRIKRFIKTKTQYKRYCYSSISKTRCLVTSAKGMRQRGLTEKEKRIVQYSQVVELGYFGKTI